MASEWVMRTVPLFDAAAVNETLGHCWEPFCSIANAVMFRKLKMELTAADWRLLGEDPTTPDTP